MLDTQPINTEVPALIGEIVLSTQEAERLLKLMSPFFSVNNNADLGAVLEQYKKDKKKRKTFGELVDVFVSSSTLNPTDLAQRLKDLVDRRNKVVHHFHETYGKDLSSGKSQLVVSALKEQLFDTNVFRDLLGAITLGLLEQMRDTIFRDQGEQYEVMDQICNDLRKRFRVNCDSN